MTINNSSVNNNANTGVTSFADSPLVINNSVINNNREGGIYGGRTVVLNGVSIVGNTTSSLGGGIYLDNGSLTVNNSTLSGNSAALVGQTHLMKNLDAFALRRFLLVPVFLESAAGNIS